MKSMETLKERLLSLDRIVSERTPVRLSPSFLAALAGALSFGLLAHGMGLFNKFSWHDDIFSLFMTGTTVELGRWMLYVLTELEKWFYGNGHFSLPLVNGFTALLCVGLSAGLIAKYFKIRSRVLSALLGAVMAVFPAVASLFGFMFTIHYYMLSLLMITGGGILICTDGAWWRKAAGVLLCGCAVGVYQAFLPVLLMLVLTDQIMFLSLREEKTGFWLKRLLVRALCVAAVMGVYFAGSKLFLQLRHVQLDGYLGIDQVGSTSLGDYLARAGTAYREFFFPTHNVLWDMFPQALYNIRRLTLCLTAVLGVWHLARAWKKSPVRALLLAAAFALVPLGCNFIFVISEDVHSLMVYGQVMLFLLPLCLAEWTEPMFPPFRRVLSLASALVLAAGCVMYVRYDNQCYMKTAFQQQEAISWNTTLVSRIESAEGFRDELPVAFVNRENMSDLNLYNLEELDFLTLGTYDDNIQGYLNNWAWRQFLARWCGFEPRTVDPATVEDWPEVTAMPSYPDDGSIQVIRDVVVVKF